MRQFEGGYSDYLIHKELEKDFTDPQTAVKKEKSEKAKATWKQREKKLKFSYKEQKEFETIDDDIAELEAKIEAMDEEMTKNATNSLKLGELMKEKESLEAALEQKMDRWVYLNDLNERILNGDA